MIERLEVLSGLLSNIEMEVNQKMDLNQDVPFNIREIFVYESNGSMKYTVIFIFHKTFNIHNDYPGEEIEAPDKIENELYPVLRENKILKWMCLFLIVISFVLGYILMRML